LSLLVTVMCNYTSHHGALRTVSRRRDSNPRTGNESDIVYRGQKRVSLACDARLNEMRRKGRIPEKP